MRSILPLFVLFFCMMSVSAQEITMFPGFWSAEYYQDDQRIDKKELKTLFSKNEAVNAHWKKSKNQELGFVIATTAELGLLVWAYSELLNDSRSNRDNAKKAVGPLLGGLGAAVVGGIFLNASNKSKRKAILTYNKQFDNKTTFRLVPVSNQNGLGLALKF